jgi:hypothetical protein
MEVFAASYYKRNSQTFLNEYHTVHSYMHADAANHLLNQTFSRFQYDCEIITDGYERSKRAGLNDSGLEMRKACWLFYNMTFVDFSAQFRSFIIKVNDLSLTEYDYALLFYVSLQSVEVQNATRDLPLSMLYDMFMPFAEENLNQWKAE